MTRRQLSFACLAAALSALAACAPPSRTGDDGAGGALPSCEEVARRKAAAQYEDDTAAAGQRTGGAVGDSALRRDLRALDAEAYRREVYAACIRARSPAAPPQ